MKYLLPVLLILIAVLFFTTGKSHAQITVSPKPTYYCIGNNQGPQCITGAPTPEFSNVSPTSESTSPSPSPASCTEPSADIVFVLDTSDSMGQISGSIVKMQAAVIAMSAYMDILSIIPLPNNLKASLVTFAQNGELNRHLTTNFESVKNTIIKQAGDLTYRTCVQCGIDLAQQELKTNGTSTNKIIVLVTDGEANWTESMNPPSKLNPTLGKQKALQTAINAHKSTGVTIYTVGVGTPGQNADFTFLKQIASATGGSFFYVPTADQLKPTYQHIASVNKVQVQASAARGLSLSACITPTPTCPPGTIPSSPVTIASVSVKQHMPHTHGAIQNFTQLILHILGLDNGAGNSSSTSTSNTTPLACVSPTPTPTDTPSPTPTLTPTPTPICKPPADFLLALDVSDSMKAKSGNQIKMTAAIKAINNFINSISQNPQDRASFVEYAQKAKIKMPLTSNFASVQSSVSQASNDFSYRTCVQCAIDAMEKQVESNTLNEHKFAVLVGDGLANWTETMQPPQPLNPTLGKQAAIQAAVNAFKKSGLVIYTIGLGTPGTTADFSDLKQIAAATGGKFLNSPTADQLDAVYQQFATSIQYGGVCQGTPTPSNSPTPSVSPTP